MITERFKSSDFVDNFISKYWDENYFHSLHHVPTNLRIGEGEDSEVFHLRETNQVMKFYLRGPWLDLNACAKLRTYVDLTNRVAQVAISDNWVIKFKQSKVEAKVRINPYDDFVFCREIGCFVGICPYVKGVRTDEWENYSLLNTQPYPYEYKQWIPEINRRVEKELKVKGIDVFLMNAKLAQDADGLTLTITDLNRSISNLRSH